MNCFKSLIFICILIFGGCASIAPTPILIGNLTDQNNKTVRLYTQCSQGPNYTPNKKDCNPQILEKQIIKTMSLATNFISADIKQPHGYDIYLATVMMYFRIAERNSNDYTRAEQIARQFFEIQKANSGSTLNKARFYLTHSISVHASWQLYHKPSELNIERSKDLRLAIKQGTILINTIENPIHKIRLLQDLQVLNYILKTIK